MANETRLRSIVRVGIGTSKAKLRVPRVSRGHVARASSKVSLGLEAGSLSSSVGTTDVGELIADAVHNDGGVESLLLTLVDNRVDGLERELSVLPIVQPSLESRLALRSWNECGDGLIPQT